MDSPRDIPEGMGFPIRKSPDQRLLAASRGLSQRATSFIASQCQGIHQMPFSRLIQRNRHARRATQARRRRRRRARDASFTRRSRKERDHAPTDLLLKSKETTRGAAQFLFTMSKTIGPGSARIAPGPRAATLLSGVGPSAPASVGTGAGTGAGTGGGERNRTVDLLLAKQALSQLSYTPGRAIGHGPSAANRRLSTDG